MGWWVGNPWDDGRRAVALGSSLFFTSLRGPDPNLPPTLHPCPGTSPHAVTNVSVVPVPKGANVSWEPGFDGGYLQRFSVWYTPL